MMGAIDSATKYVYVKLLLYLTLPSPILLHCADGPILVRQK